MSSSAPKGVGDVSELTTPLPSMTVSQHALPVVAPTLKDLALALERRAIDRTGKIVTDLGDCNYDPHLSQEGLRNVTTFLNAPRTLRGHPFSILQHVAVWHALWQQY